MNKDEIQNLIGGYATGSLTEEERRALFDAALEDQELFDALQNEQALKELFDDPFSREQVRRAAAESLPPAKLPWFRNTWIWAAGVSVTIAAVLLVVFMQPSPQPDRTAYMTPPKPVVAQPPQTPEPSVNASEPVVDSKKPRKAAKREEASANTAPAGVPGSIAENDKLERQVAAAPVPAPSVQSISQIPGGPSQAPATTQSVEVTAAAPMTKDGAPESRPAFNALRARKALAAPAQLIYSLARRLESGAYIEVPTDTLFQPGEKIRLTVFPRAPGMLSVMEWDADDSTWNRIFPLGGATFQAPLLENYAVPTDITVKPGERLLVTVGSASTEIAIRTTAPR